MHQLTYRGRGIRTNHNPKTGQYWSVNEATGEVIGYGASRASAMNAGKMLVDEWHYNETSNEDW